MKRSIRFRTLLGLFALAGLVAIAVVATMLAVLVPSLSTDVNSRNHTLGSAVAARTETFLADFQSELERLARYVESQPRGPAGQLDFLANAFANTSASLDVLFVVNDRSRVVALGEPTGHQSSRSSLMNIDLSGYAFVREALQTRRSVWSDTYLSTHGHVAVGIAVPVDIPAAAGDSGPTPGVMVGEIDLAEISRFVRTLGEPSRALLIVVDETGRIVAHPDPERAMSQENISNLLPNWIGKGSLQNLQFRFEGTDYVGSSTVMRFPHWTVLVARPPAVMYATLRSTLLAAGFGTLLSLVIAMFAAIVASRRLARRAASFTANIQAIAAGNYAAQIPSSRTNELEDLSESMRQMVQAVLDREARLRSSEAKYRGVVESIPELITRVDTTGRLTFVNHMAEIYYGLPAAECIGLPAFDFVHPDDRAATTKAFGEWLGGDTSEPRQFENRQVARNGAVHLMHWNIVAERGPSGDQAEGEITGFSSVARDVTAARAAEQSMRLAASVFSASAEGICITDASALIVSVNPALLNISGYSERELVGHTTALFSSGRHDQRFYRDMWSNIIERGVWRGEIWNRRKDGELFPAWLTITAIRNHDGAVTNYVGTVSDMSERKQQQAHIHFLAHHDALTKLPNRMLLDDRIDQAISAARRCGDHTAVLFIDLDRFKLINDTLGHDVGDRLLEHIAERLKGALRETETVARLGGDEFVILIPELPDIERVAVIAHKVREAIATPTVIDGQTLHITPSIGISVFPEDGTDGRALLRNADTAMYHAKECGRNNFQFFTAAMNTNVQERVTIESDLRNALARGEFELHYQPQVDSRSQAVFGMEALLRWRHPERGLLLPGSFITIAEETGLIIAIGEWVLHEACRQVQHWHDAGHSGLRVAVNLSARQLQNQNLLKQVQSAIDKSGITPQTLELEITESMLMTDPEAATALSHRLTDLGLRLAIDDFGSGYSSLSYLKRFPVAVLKIDRSFVHDLSSEPGDSAIIAAIMAMATSLGLDVIAEGVETAEQLRILGDHGCHAVQGYYFSRPRPAEEIDRDGFIQFGGT